eukprot:TRINITY_DN8372_c1_g4_i1.p1 TRINITY_DN8372_c1_g4~~TRINITY_DN8372_c1_g4_i1.p1  ORF type:complete len:155 (-),score=33.19 TRINITY_DN8372_c1_g4_i1:243-707(-)
MKIGAIFLLCFVLLAVGTVVDAVAPHTKDGRSWKVAGKAGNSESDVLASIKSFIAENNIAIFSKSYCPYCRRAKGVFAELGVEPAVIELDQREEGAKIQDALSDMVGRRTVPQVFINGKHIGGSDDTVALFHSGELEKLVKAADAAADNNGHEF